MCRSIIFQKHHHMLGSLPPDQRLFISQGPATSDMRRAIVFIDGSSI
jgi:hypothetical protein